MLKNVQTVVGVEMSSSSKNSGVSGLILVKSSPPVGPNLVTIRLRMIL